MGKENQVNNPRLMALLLLAIWIGVFFINGFFTGQSPRSSIVEDAAGGVGFALVFYYLEQRR
jgi:VIT1/CCC1 family predicted Fe2+/Mn2+ transporter